MTTFLPKDYDVPKTPSNYMSIEQGSNKFRILSSAIIGWVGWKDKKPLRFKNDEKPVDLTDFERQRVSHFWAFVVWNYEDERIQILELIQKTIQKPLLAYVNKEEWGDPKGYDITINKEGEKLKTKYDIVMTPPKELDKAIAEKYAATDIKLEKLFDGSDPFESEEVGEEVGEDERAPLNPF